MFFKRQPVVVSFSEVPGLGGGGEVCPVTNLPSVVADALKACRTLAATAS